MANPAGRAIDGAPTVAARYALEQTPDPDATPTPPLVDVASHETILPAISSPDAAVGLRRVAGNRKLYHNLLTRCIVG